MDTQGTPTESHTIQCLRCGYDLRLLQSDLCPECGQPIEREAEKVSRVPWVHRRNQGYVRSYFKTVWLVTFSQRRLNEELIRRADVSAAKRFWLITATLLALPLMLLYAVWWAGLGSIAFDPPSILQEPDASMAVYHELIMPWGLGGHFSPVMLVLIWVTVTTNLGIATYLVDTKSQNPEQRSRAIAAGYYAGGSIAWLAAMISLGLGVATLASRTTSDADKPLKIFLLFTAAGSFTLLVYWLRLVRLRVRVRNSGFFGLLRASPLPPLLWLANTTFWLLVIPWMIGYAWVLLRAW